MELENFGRYLFELFDIKDKQPDWPGIVHGYKTRRLTSKKFGKPHINYMTAKKFGLDAGLLLVKSQRHKITVPRNTAEYMMSLCGHTHEDIADYYQKARWTVGQNIESIMGLYETCPQIKEKINQLKIELL